MPHAAPVTALSVAIDRHLDRGRRLFHAPIAPDRVPAVRDFIAAAEVLVGRAEAAGGATGHEVRRLRDLHRALADRIGAGARRA